MKESLAARMNEDERNISEKDNMLSAAVYYNLSTYRPDAIDVAIPRKAKVSTLPDWPELNVCYFTDDRFDVGIKTVEDENN